LPLPRIVHAHKKLTGVGTVFELKFAQH